MASSKKSHEGPAGSHSMAAKLRRYLPLYLMFLPGAIYLLINNYIPMAGIIVAFKNTMHGLASGRARSAAWQTLSSCSNHRMHGSSPETRFFITLYSSR